MEALDEFGTDVSGQHSSRKERHLVAETPRLIVTDCRLVFVDSHGAAMHQTIYDVGYLRAYLKFVQRWNEQAEAKVQQAESREGELERWIFSKHDGKRFGVANAVDMLTWAERGRGLLGPKPYLLMTESTFRPVSAERQEALEEKGARSGHLLERVKLGAEERKIGMVFSYKPVQLFVHEKEALDTLVAAVSPKLPALTDYLTRPEGLASDCSLPPGATQGLAAYRPADPESG